jgi:surface antigen
MEEQMKCITFMLVGMMALLATSCANLDMNKGGQGAIGGAAGGALLGQAIGRSTEATLIGAAVGTMLGYIVGNEMDKFDRRELNHTYEFGRSGQATSWQNPDSGNQYQVIPQPAYTSPTNPQRPCRQAEILATIDGRTEKTYTTACRNEAGQWVLQN